MEQECAAAADGKPRLPTFCLRKEIRGEDPGSQKGFPNRAGLMAGIYNQGVQSTTKTFAAEEQQLLVGRRRSCPLHFLNRGVREFRGSHQIKSPLDQIPN
jgi:hypothetical protein